MKRLSGLTKPSSCLSMSFPCRWGVLLVALWIQVGFGSGYHVQDGTVDLLPRADILLLKDEQNPKCFTRTERDFTCFFETADNRSHDFFYTAVHRGRKRCEMLVRRTEEGTFLHICSFPDSDVFLFLETRVEVVERDANACLYKRDISVEDHVLLDPPFDVSLHQNDQSGHLQVSWRSKIPEYQENNVIYRIRFSSEGLSERIIEAKDGHILDSLVPGEEVEVQVTVKCALNPGAGHWSSWSRPVRAVVPQSSDDILLMCSTSDLQNITCRWNGSRYGAENEFKLFYQVDLSEGWTEWTKCLTDNFLAELCSFQGDESRRVRVKLSSGPAALSRTFYTPEFTINNSIKTSPPSHPNRSLEGGKLCLKWEAPLPSLWPHLQYEVGYQIRGGGAWMMVSLKGPESGTCLEVVSGSQYNVKIRAKPTGPIYSGHWSDWSDVIIGYAPSGGDTWLMLCVPVSMLMTAIIFISLFPKYLSKLKLYIWPPVPNLDKVLQGFLAEINGQIWTPALPPKHCCEETPSSVVEIMSEEDQRQTPGSETRSRLLAPEWSPSSREHVDGSPGSEVFPDYVTLSKDSDIIYPKGNKNINEYETLKQESLQKCQPSCSEGSVCTQTAVVGDFLNCSYVPLAESADRFHCKITAGRGPGNLYTNLPCN